MECQCHCHHRLKRQAMVCLCHQRPRRLAMPCLCHHRLRGLAMACLCHRILEAQEGEGLREKPVVGADTYTYD